MIQDHYLCSLTGAMRQRLVAGSLALVIAGGTLIGFSPPGAAQDDGTGAALSPPGECAIVVSTVDPAATPIASAITPESVEESATPAATPAIGAATPLASPVSDDATPVASPVVALDPADPIAPLRDELTTTTESLFACLNERRFDTFAQLTSDTYRGQLFGSDQPLPVDVFLGLAASLPESEHRLIELDDVAAIDATTVSAEVIYLSAFQRHTAVWTFSRQTVAGLLAWVLESEQRIPVSAPQGMATINVVFEENGYRVTPATVFGADVVLNLDNPTDGDHEALILRFDAGAGIDDVLQNTSATLPDGVTMIGQSTVLAGDRGAMRLTGLEPGTYTIVDLFPDEDGIPHLSSGMVATFRVLF